MAITEALGSGSIARPSAFSRARAFWIARQAAGVAVLIVSYSLIWHTRAWISFVDEDDNRLGGFLIAHGRALYTDYFSHHLPLPYYLAAIPALLGVTSLEGFRIYVSLMILACWLFVVIRFRRFVPAPVRYALVGSIALTHFLFLGQMLIEDTFPAYAILILVLYFYAFPKLDFRLADQIVISALIYVAATSTLISVYPLAALAAFYCWRKVPTLVASRRLSALGAEARFLGIILLPLLTTLLFLVASGTIGTFVDDAITFNRVYYARYDLSADPLYILRSILGGYYRYVLANLHPSALLSINGFLVFANAAAAVVLGRRRGVTFGLFFLGITVLSRSQGVAFHDQGYYLLSLLGIAFVGWAALGWLGRLPKIALARILDPRGVDPRDLATITVKTVLAGTYLVLAVLFFHYVERIYPWVVQPPSADPAYRVVEAATGPEDPIWVGPMDPGAYLTLGRAPAARYGFYFPWLADSPAINRQLIADLEKNQPPVIVFDEDFQVGRIDGGETQWYAVSKYARVVETYLSEKYVPLDSSDPDLRSVFLRKDRAAELVQRLERAGVYHPAVTLLP